MSRQKQLDQLWSYYNSPLEREDGSCEGANSGDDGKGSDSGHILKVKTTRSLTN